MRIRWAIADETAASTIDLAAMLTVAAEDTDGRPSGLTRTKKE
jgi:hypothetical protein